MIQAPRDDFHSYFDALLCSMQLRRAAGTMSVSALLTACGAVQAAPGCVSAPCQSPARAASAAGLAPVGLRAGLPPRSPARPRLLSSAGAAAAAGRSVDVGDAHQQPLGPGSLPAAAGHTTSGAVMTAWCLLSRPRSVPRRCQLQLGTLARAAAPALAQPARARG